MSSPSYGAGGFLQAHQLLSPPPSSVDSSSTAGSLLPEPRSRALRSGGAKETALMNYMDRNITQINRRYAMKYSVNTDGDGLFRGYNNFSEIVKDVDKLVDIVWVSGTISLQVTYLLSLALLLITYMPAFPAAPRSMFRLLAKLDLAFASLILGRDLDSGAPLPMSSSGRGVSTTEKVRIKGIIQSTRIAVVALMATDQRQEPEAETLVESSENLDDDMNLDEAPMVGQYDMDIAKVYDQTLIELGDTLGGPSIGLPN